MMPADHSGGSISSSSAALQLRPSSSRTAVWLSVINLSLLLGTIFVGVFITLNVQQVHFRLRF